MPRRPTAIVAFSLPALACVLACANPDKRTLADLHRVKPDVAELRVQVGHEHAMHGYRRFLEEAPESALTPEAMRRLADLKLEKEYGFVPGAVAAPSAPGPAHLALDAGSPDPESEDEFVRRAAAEREIAAAAAPAQPSLPGGEPMEWSGPLEAIELYDRILETYPDYAYNDWVLYQKARAFDELGRNDEAIVVIERLIAEHPDSRYTDEVQFRRAEYFFTRRKFRTAEQAYAAITARGAVSEYYELALYKLGWALYKQEMHDEALDQYMALLDHKVSTGYDFSRIEESAGTPASDETEERRIADTFRVISLSFSSLGGPGAVERYFADAGQRVYVDRVYKQLAEFYFEKLRYHDAANAYQAFVELNPLHPASPRFGMRVIEIYEAGAFPRLVLESKKEFASRYGLASEYWLHFEPSASTQVLADLKRNLGDLANHYHAVFQADDAAESKHESFAEALLWYRGYLASFPGDPETPGLHYRLADLLLEHEDFEDAALAYERTAYDYGEHAQASAAAYAAVYAQREREQRAPAAERASVTAEAVASSLRFVDAFPQHDKAAVVLGAAADDLYGMARIEEAMATARRLIDGYPEAELATRRSAWAVVAHGSLDLGEFVAAEHAYAEVLAMTAEDDASRQAVVDSLAAAIYKQGERANAAADPRGAAGHFLRIADVAPGSEIRPVAEYDAAATLIGLEDWTAAAGVLESFRQQYPSHALSAKATKQIAFVYRELGSHARAGAEYERVAAEAGEPGLQREALLLAAELHREAEQLDRALTVYERYTREFPAPLEAAIEARFEMAKIHGERGDETRQHAQLREIVDLDARAGSARSARVRVLAARSALVLSEGSYLEFEQVALVQPFEKSLQQKQNRMATALRAFEALVEYEAADVTAAATFYIAQIYLGFSQALMASERPAGLSDAEMTDYEDVLEEEAFPFEERAIAVHEKNLELLGVGIFNLWIERSLEQLAALMPGRYAKFEASPGWIVSLDRYDFRAPLAPAEPDARPAAPGALEGSPDAAPEPESLPEIERQARAPQSTVEG